MDKNHKAVELLELLANALLDRNINNSNPLFFSSNEIALVERWLEGLELRERNPTMEGRMGCAVCGHLSMILT
jgi:hypothetical protein